MSFKSSLPLPISLALLVGLFSTGSMAWADPNPYLAEGAGAAPDNAQAGQSHRDGDWGGGKGGCHPKGQKQGQGEGKQHAKEAFAKKLNMSPEQQAKFKAAHEQFRTDNAGQFQAMKAKHQELQALRQGNGDPAKIEALNTELRQMRDALKQKKLAMQKETLTPEQLQQMEQFRQKMGQHRGQHRPQKSGDHAPNTETVDSPNN